MTDTNKERAEFENFWRDTRGERKARRELVPHENQPQTYISDSASRHYVTWRAARAAKASAAAPPLYQVQRTDGSPFARWENCTKDFYEATVATGRYGGFDDGPVSEARALCVCSSAPKVAT